jgi:phospholipid-translocating ATPase
MSVIVRDPDGHIFLFCKGADDVIFDRLVKHNNSLIDATKQHMNEYGEAGLRTLALAYRVLDKDIFADWQVRVWHYHIPCTEIIMQLNKVR